MRSALIGATALSLFALFAPPAYAQRGGGANLALGANGVVEVCVGPNGQMRLVTPAQACSNSEVRVAWNVTGVQGPPGPQGSTGPAGPAGAQGPAGPAGAAGTQGTEGAAGPAGPAGAQGAAGAQGPQGTQGAQGATGPQGDPGPQGVQGSQGTQGDAGATGAQGPVGPAGPAGANGVDGAAGAQGADGTDGPRGADGLTGPQGPEGPQGPPGRQLLRVLDASGTQVGEVIGVAGDAAGYFYPSVLIVAGSDVFVLRIQRDTITSREALWFTSNDCSGQSYLPHHASYTLPITSVLSRTGGFDVYAPDLSAPLTFVTIRSRRGGAAPCSTTNFTEQAYPTRPPIFLPHLPPFTVEPAP